MSIILKINKDAVIKIKDNIPIVISTKGIPRRKTGTVSNAALLLISTIISLTNNIPDVKPKESIIVSKILFARSIHKKTAAAVMPQGK